MKGTQHSFIDLFESEYLVGDKKIKLNRILIPMVQRDYAQGREHADVNRIRDRFLDSLFNAVVNHKPITLDFIYGDIDDDGVMVPIDGQQRLTTLFLLHWYAAKKSCLTLDQSSCLEKFSYETRTSSRDFCKSLIRFQPEFKDALDFEIINQAWFPLSWKKDPTIASMLVMLTAIDQKFNSVSNLWSQLKRNAITFHFLPIKDMGLTDELYIKMNSRGKPLTLFENFKAELERLLKELNFDNCDRRIISKIDLAWTDLLWRYCNPDSKDQYEDLIDNKFICYFRFICDVIIYCDNKSPRNFEDDPFVLLSELFSSKAINAKKNISTLESFFDCWCNINDFDNPELFLKSFIQDCQEKTYPKYERGKVIINSPSFDVLKECLTKNLERKGNDRPFPLGRMILLYAIALYLQNAGKGVSYNQFIERIRIVNNLIKNSQDEISDRADQNRIPNILAAVKSLILNGNFNEGNGLHFNSHQVSEEIDKMEFLSKNPEWMDFLYELEDHELLYGQIAILGLENLKYAKRFQNLFLNCNLDKIDCALMAIGNYMQKENCRRYQSDSRNNVAWKTLFHRSSNKNFDGTKKVILSLLSRCEHFSDQILEEVIQNYISDCEKSNIYPWRYYYVKYPSYRCGRYGKLNLQFDPNAREQYLFSVMETKSNLSESSYLPYLKEADPGHLSVGFKGQRLVYDKCYIECKNDGYIVFNTDGTVKETILIEQDNENIDEEDRVIKLKKYLDENAPYFSEATSANE